MFIVNLPKNRLIIRLYFVILQPDMRRVLTILMLMCAVGAAAQETAGDPTFVPTVKVSKVLRDGDSIQYMEM